MGRKKDHFSIFSLSFSFFGKEWNRNWEWEKTEKPFFFYPLQFLFVSFLPFFLWFSLFFRSIFFFGSGKRRMKFPLSLPSFLLFGGEKWEEQLEKRKEVLSIFRSFFLDFFFLKTLLFFSFSFFFGRGKRIEEIAFFAIIHFYKNIVVFKNEFFGKKAECFFYTRKMICPLYKVFRIFFPKN